MATIAVVGAVTVDQSYYIPKFPKKGDSIIAYDANIRSGGKAAGLSVSISRLEHKALIIATIGDDANAIQVTKDLEREANVDTSHLIPVDSPTDIVGILVTEDGTRTNIATILASQKISEKLIDDASEDIKNCAALITTAEIDLDVCVHSIRHMAEVEKPTFFYLSPGRFTLTSDVGAITKYVIGTEKALRVAVGADAKTPFEEVSSKLLDWGIEGIFSTDGVRHCSYIKKDESQNFEGFHVPMIDLTGASTAFVGGLVTAIVEGKSFDEAILLGLASGALSAANPGNLESMPQKTAVGILSRRR